MGLSGRERALLDLLCSHHDLGMVRLDPEAQGRPGPLSEPERMLLRKHPETGYRIARNGSPDLAGIADLILMHHERPDGSGYPQGLSGESVPLLVRIFTVAEATEAVIRGRPWRKPLPFGEARAELSAASGTLYDPEVVRVLFE
jgi:HD-GYP domain-containing protein (c-di-GMP phosphodiesterase class II)